MYESSMMYDVWNIHLCMYTSMYDVSNRVDCSEEMVQRHGKILKEAYL